MHEAPSLKRFFEADHEKLDQRFVNYMNLKNESYPRAVECFFLLKTGLQRHILWEEEIIFPLFLKKTDNERANRVMRLEHRRILEILDDLTEKIQHGNRRTEAEEYQLLFLLGEHALNEEMVLYPAIDAMITLEESEEAFRQLNHGVSTDKRAS